MAEPLRDAMNSYYRAERNNLVAILAGAGLATLGAIAFRALAVPYLARGGFYTGAAEHVARGFALGVAILIVPITLVALWRGLRESRLAARRSAALDTAESPRAIADEALHIATVVTRSTRRQGAALVLGIIAIMAAAMLGHPFVVGIAASVLLLVVSEQVLDHLTNARATTYARSLGARAAEALG